MNEPELLGEVDRRYLRAAYRYRAHEFTIECQGRAWWWPFHKTWWCFHGVSVPIREHEWYQSEHEVWQPWCIDHESGFASLSRKGILKKICKAVDKEIRKDLAEEQLRTAIT